MSFGGRPRCLCSRVGGGALGRCRDRVRRWRQLREHEVVSEERLADGVHLDGSVIHEPDACVPYGAQGGVLISKTKSQVDCEFVGALFGTVNETGVGFTHILWTCNGDGVGGGYPDAVLVPDCVADGGNTTAWAPVGTQGRSAFTCGHD